MDNLQYQSKLEKIITSNFNKLSLIIAGFCLLFGTSFGVFLITTDKYKASEMYIGNLLYTMNIRPLESPDSVSGNTVTIPDEYTYTIMIDIGSLNPIKSKYKLQYSTTCTDCLVFISDVSGWNTEGFLNAQDVGMDSKTVKVIVVNATGESATISFAVTGGFTYNSYNSINLTEGYSDDFENYYVDSSTSKVLTQIIKDDTECIPTSDSPCLYGGEEHRNYITNNEEIYRMLGVYLIDGIEYIKIIQTTNESVTNYTNLATTANTYISGLSNTKTNYLTGGITAISKDDYLNIGGSDSYLNNGTEMLTNTIENTQVYYVNTEGELALKGQSENSNFRPVLTLKTDARVKSRGLGTVDNPYVITNSLSDIEIDEINIDGTPANDMPTSGVYTMTSSCTGGSVSWIDRNYFVEFNITNSPLSCNLNFTHQDIKFKIKVNDVDAAIPTTGTYTMTYLCVIGDADLSWDNTDYSITTNIIEGPVLCNINFTSAT